jgi:acyl-CoA thioesterase
LSHPEPSTDPSDEPAAIFRRDGERLVPTLFAQGPWNPNHLHGGPICGALARAIEACESPVPMRVARMTVEMTRAVPMAPCTVHAEVTRAGRRIQQIDARIEVEGRPLARASALRVRIGQGDARLDVPFDDPVPERAPGPPRDPEMMRLFSPGFIRSLEFLRTRLATRAEAGITWARLRVPLVEGEAVTAFVRLATLSDFASGTGNPLDFTRFTSINPDLSLHVLREPRGEWIGLRARSGVAADGIGQSHAALFDAEGAVARALVSLLVERRTGESPPPSSHAARRS